jgi:hypothetical protein
MKRAILAAFALLMGTGAAMAAPCGGSNCDIDEPIVNAPPQDCAGSSCARPEPAPFQTAAPGGGPNIAIRALIGGEICTSRAQSLRLG